MIDVSTLSGNAPYCIASDLQIAAERTRMAADEQLRPCVIFKPRIYLDGNRWCALLGDNLQDGVAGFGTTPEAAFEAFDKAFRGEQP